MADRQVINQIISTIRGMSPDEAREFLQRLSDEAIKPVPAGTAPRATGYTAQQAEILQQSKSGLVERAKAELREHSADRGNGVIAVDLNWAQHLATKYGMDLAEKNALIKSVSQEHHAAYQAGVAPVEVKPSKAETILRGLGYGDLLNEQENDDGNETES